MKLPTNRRNNATYGKNVGNYRSQKDTPRQKRIVTGGNLIGFTGDVSTIKVDITTAKLIFNITISTKGAQLLCCDIKIFYLGKPMDICKYIQLLWKLL